jgi:hypothetical protein
MKFKETYYRIDLAHYDPDRHYALRLDHRGDQTEAYLRPAGTDLWDGPKTPMEALKQLKVDTGAHLAERASGDPVIIDPGQLWQPEWGPITDHPDSR